MNKKKHERAMKWLAGQRNRDLARENMIPRDKLGSMAVTPPFTEFLYRAAMAAKDHDEFEAVLHTASSDLHFTIGEQERERRAWRYVITGEGCMALAVHSKLTWADFCEYVRKQSIPTDKTRKRVFRWGTLEFVEPVVHSGHDFADFSAALIGM